MKKRPPAISPAAIRERIRRYDQEIANFDAQSAAAKLKRDALADFLESVVKPTDNTNGKHTNGATGEGPTAAVYRVLREQPGLTPSQIVAKISGTVRTGAKNREKSLYQTVLNLKNQQKIKATPEGGLEIANKN